MISSAIIPQPLAKLPWRLIFLVVGIGAIGITTLYSAAGGAAQPWATKQAIVFMFFMAVAIVMSWTSESTIKKVAFPIYIVVTVMLVLVEMLGFVGKGAQRWLDLGFIRLQPSEIMKPGIVLVLARRLSSPSRLSAQTDRHLPRSRKRPAGGRLSHQPVEDRHRVRRHLR